MVKRAYDLNTREVSGNENFRIKESLVQKLSIRIHNYVDRYRELVKESLLIPDFLETFVERFALGAASNRAFSFRPPFDYVELSYLALVFLHLPCSLDQIMIFIVFLFPSLQNDKQFFKEENFETLLNNDQHVKKYFMASSNQTLFVIQEESHSLVLTSVRTFFSKKYEMLQKSIYSSEVLSLLLNLLSADQ